MGTRHLTMVVSNKETKVAQYGQWDGYPEGQGVTVLEFLQSCDIDLFRSKVNNLHWITQEESDAIEKDENWTQKYPHLSRDAGAQILNAIQYGEIRKRGTAQKCTVDFLVNSEDFINESLFCEYAYLIDLDKMTFEIYDGFNKSPMQKAERFYSANPDESGYYPCKHVVTFSLQSIPLVQDFLKPFKIEDAE